MKRPPAEGLDRELVCKPHVVSYGLYSHVYIVMALYIMACELPYIVIFHQRKCLIVNLFANHM